MKRFLLVTALSLTAALAQAGVVVNNGVSGSTINNFNALPASGNAAGLITQTGASYGERFAGQTLSTVGGFDTLTGTPTGPLALLANASAGSNIGIESGGSGGSAIYGNSNNFGMGALSILLSDDTDVFGFNVLGANDGEGGTIRVQFFNASGALLTSLAQASRNGFFGFATTGGDLIRAVSITNTDPAGVLYDNVTFNSAVGTVPEPGSFALAALALAGLGIGRRGIRKA